ncbi:MAG: SRPBCC family protein [Pseudomonadales bacterium]|nr:SRPBCC family protein [Pseudomonadales bacterium]MDA0957408.1 SRPBCC family protein [Pseudomonadota bacterium]
MLKFEHNFDAAASLVWQVVGTPDRVDWVPGVDKCTFDGEVRTLDLPGAGTIQERIIKLDASRFELIYQCIASPMPLEHHEASMQLKALNPHQCQLVWQASIRPEAFEPFLKDSMQGALIQLVSVVSELSAR